MEIRTYITTDKSAWGKGPWQTEADKMQWQDAATGLPCLIVRGPMGALCGYVGVAKGHPMFGEDYDNVNVDVHSGLTFSKACSHGDEATGICHVPAPGETDTVWWFGFDCAHFGDLIPKQKEWGIPSLDGTYRDFAYVTAEVAKLALQLKAMEG